jgi:hypothetical protein
MDEVFTPGKLEAQADSRLSLFKVQFQELYERHLCRHSQYGINVSHLATVIGSYFGLFGIAAWLANVPWLWLPVPVAYLLLLGFNVPLRVFVACVGFVVVFFAAFLTLPVLPIWVSLGLIVLSHFVQNWSHKIWTVERDMTEFNKKYKKGLFLFVLLSLYELPILLNYLLFGRKDWRR